MITSKKHMAFRRFLAFGIDWLVMVAWAGALFALVMWRYSGQPPGPSGPWTGQALGFLSMTLPILFYFSICEASGWGATIGKRVLSLRVVGAKPERIPFSRHVLRNVVKFAPWELGHLVANQAIFASSSIPIWVYVPMIFSFTIPMWWIISIYVQGDSPYDRITNIRVMLKDQAG